MPTLHLNVHNAFCSSLSTWIWNFFKFFIIIIFFLPSKYYSSRSMISCARNINMKVTENCDSLNSSTNNWQGYKISDKPELLKHTTPHIVQYNNQLNTMTMTTLLLDYNGGIVELTWYNFPCFNDSGLSRIFPRGGGLGTFKIIP